MTKQLFDDRCLGSTTYKSYSNLRVDSDPNLIRNGDSQAIINTNLNEFDQFMAVNNLWETVLSLDNNKDLEEIFLQGRLSRKLVQTLKEFLKEIHFPLAIRSSSLLEDSQYQPLAGMY